MSKYSLLFEADTYYEISPFRFPVYKDFTPGETKGFDKLNKNHAASTYSSMKLAQRIAKEHKLKPGQALKILGNISDEANQDYLFEYAEDVQALSDAMTSQDEQTAQYVTLFMQMRGEVRLPGSDEWQKTHDWTSSDTDQVPGSLLKRIYEFINWERYGWPEEGNEKLKVIDVTPKSPVLRSSSTTV